MGSARPWWKTTLIWLAWIIAGLVAVCAAFIFWPLPDWVWWGAVSLIVIYNVNAAVEEYRNGQRARHQDITDRLTRIETQIYDIAHEQRRDKRAESGENFFTRRQL